MGFDHRLHPMNHVGQDLHDAGFDDRICKVKIGRVVPQQGQKFFKRFEGIARLLAWVSVEEGEDIRGGSGRRTVVIGARILFQHHIHTVLLQRLHHRS